MGVFSKSWVKSVGLVIVLSAAGYGGCRLHISYVVKEAEKLSAKGFHVAAAESLETYRKCLVSTESSCRTLLNIYYSARWIPRLEWAAESCLSAGFEIPESYFGLATAREANGRGSEAVQILGGVVSKFESIPDILYRMAQMLARQENHSSAVIAYQQAMQRAPNNGGLALEALEYFSRINAWAAAIPVANALKAVKTEDPAIKLLLARVYKGAGDSAAQQAMVAEGRDLLERAPNREQLERTFSDVLGVAKKK